MYQNLHCRTSRGPAEACLPAGRFWWRTAPTRAILSRMADSGFKRTLAALLCNLGFTANSLTLLGLALAALSGWFSYEGKFFEAAAALLASGLLDLMDGAVARISGKSDAFGGIFDSTLDRYGDAFVLGGLLLFCARTDRQIYAFAAFLALAGSFAVSYVRARAECELDACRVGFWERGERIGVLVISLATRNVGTGLWLLAISTQVTAFQRLFEARRQVRVSDARPAPALARSTALYAVQAAVFASLAAAFRLPF